MLDIGFVCAEKSRAKLKNDVPINRDNRCYNTVLPSLVLLPGSKR